MNAIHRACVLALLAVPAFAQHANDDLEFFEQRIRPVLAERCQSCHGTETARAGLRLDHIEFLLKGGQSGPAVVRGEPLQSRLVRAIRYQDVALQMPPRGRLSAEEVQAFEQWIERGAAWPDEPVPQARNATAEPEAFSLEQRKADHWSWRPIADPVVPEGTSTHPVDAFLERSQRARGIEPAPLADRTILIRRLFFDLLGLPPRPEDVDAFLADEAPDAWERLVDRTLSSPRFGERWARHWMDLVRYAESCGHEFDYPIRHAEAYRDYVIRAFNDDVAYDQFVREHIAGDLLETPRRHPVEDFDESILGTGFWHFAQATHAPVDIRQDEGERVDNQIDVMSKTFLGLTVACARCHDHKFDAITTADYYALAGFLQSSRRQVAFLDPGHRIERATREIAALHDARRERLLAHVPRTLDPADVARALLAVDDYLSARHPAESEVEAESLRVIEKTKGNYRPQALGARAGWSDDQHMWWTEAQPGDRLVLAFDVGSSGRHALQLRLTKARDYGIIRVFVDDQPALESFDLYDPNVVPTGPVDLGTFALNAGEHRLTFELLGANELAIKSYMCGIDTLKVTREPESGAQEPPALSAVAATHGLTEEELAAWVKGFEGVPEKGHALSGWARVAHRDRPWPEERTTFGEERAPAAANRDDVVFETFDDGFDAWYRTGHAFSDRVTQRGDHRLAANGVHLLRAGVAHSGRFGGRPRGALRSQTFVIEKRGILYRAAGTGGRIRVIIDSYVMDEFNALLFGGITFEVKTDGEYRWFHQRGDIAKFTGHRAHIEILDEGDGWIAVDEIRFSDHGPPAEVDQELHVPAGSREEMARQFGEAMQGALQRFRTGIPDDRDLDVATFLLEDSRGPVDAEGDERAFAEGLARQRALEAAIPAPMLAMASQDGTGEDEYVFIRGKHQNQGPTIPRRFLEALAGAEQAPIERGSGRLELAERILARDNPYPARVIVNRLWQHLFGEGIVPTPDNFGVLGRPPTHPELLDYLAARLRDDQGWSLKGVLRLLVTAEAYRRSSALRDEAIEAKDPLNETWHRARVRRLEGEPLRDAILAVAGTLRNVMYGESIGTHLTPFMQGRGRPRGGPLDGAGRRSVYLQVQRNFLAPFMLAFDTPIPFTTVGRRSRSNLPAQALILMNDPFVIEQARHWSERVRRAADTFQERIAVCYREAYGREATWDEVTSAAAFFEIQGESMGVESAERREDARLWDDYCHVLWNVKEFYHVR
ncbi:MAG: DUF1549 domain-containing protein [Planctomycetes bacterium]|nr:DUF1549 domain-containing protein [Planctomycetota bacterium]MCB9891721.1 DUF1549 domain-containing protein [Planctomycetota bacterium]